MSGTSFILLRQSIWRRNLIVAWMKFALSAPHEVHDGISPGHLAREFSTFLRFQGVSDATSFVAVYEIDPDQFSNPAWVEYFRSPFGRINLNGCGHWSPCLLNLQFKMRRESISILNIQLALSKIGMNVPVGPVSSTKPSVPQNLACRRVVPVLLLMQSFVRQQACLVVSFADSEGGRYYCLQGLSLVQHPDAFTVVVGAER
ncbi:hypothetical protein BD410DRAFT_867812 [Rickenella mellea]|uniref:Uncharacterized protein n=1 Tax=Rickenella mellea TaxID=50990 RepID=A0A4Y7Q0Z6_9AGAM|nr:hypothetical protein BD410DRAFT_867812 [Rickenella mellea]